MTLRAIIDTDPGIDDAIAILFALRHPGLKVAAPSEITPARLGAVRGELIAVSDALTRRYLS